MSKCSIISEQFDSKIIAEFADLSRVEYKDLETVTSLPHLNWKHLNGAFGPSTALHLKDGEKIVGRTILQSKIFHLNGKKVPVAFVTDALVHPSYRRPVSNFLSLTLQIKEMKNFDLVFHSSNEKTEDIYTKVLRFPNPFSLKGFGFPLRLAKLSKFLKPFDWPYQLVLKALLSLVNPLELGENAPKNFDEFCAEECRKNNFLTERNSEILKWRFLDAPLWPAEISHIYDKEEYCGYVVSRQVDLSGKKFFVIMDFLLSDKTPSFRLRCAILRKAVKTGSDILFTLLNPQTKLSKKLLGFPFFHVPDKFLPHATPIFIHANNPELAALEKENLIHLTLSDLDYF